MSELFIIISIILEIAQSYPLTNKHTHTQLAHTRTHTQIRTLTYVHINTHIYIQRTHTQREKGVLTIGKSAKQICLKFQYLKIFREQFFLQKSSAPYIHKADIWLKLTIRNFFK